jgi:peptide/nickel transport system permease protein
MSTTVIEEGFEDKRVIPQSGKYGPSTFATTVSILSIVLIVAIGGLIIWGVLTSLIALSEFVQAAEQGFPANPRRLNPDGTPKLVNGDIDRIDFSGYFRYSMAGYFLAIALYYPTRWLMRTYGRQSVQITDQEIVVKKFPRTKYVIPWDGILDITVKESSSVFANISRNVSKITIYTMDRAIPIESMTLRKQKELSNRLFLFGESLEERVIDFGYGAQISVVWRRIKRSNVGVLGLLLVVFWLAVSVFAIAVLMVNPVNTIESQIQPKVLFNFWNPNYVNISHKDTAPNAEHWFGTDVLGRDIFARVLFGSFYSILIGVVATFVSVALGAFIGASSGYLGGTIDQIIQRLTEVLTSMPGLPVLLLVSAAFTPLFTRINLEGAYYLVVFTIFSFISWGGTARIIRSEVLSLKKSEFVQAERVLGATHYRIITKHIMPNAFSTVIIFFTLGVAGNIISVASLAFLGFGSESTLVWGSDLNEAINNQPTEKWWGTTFISLCLFSLVLGFNLMGDVLRDALDPRLKN